MIHSASDHLIGLFSLQSYYSNYLDYSAEHFVQLSDSVWMGALVQTQVSATQLNCCSIVMASSKVVEQAWASLS
jgi:hypothetical protein